MSGGGQRTLFQTWGANIPQKVSQLKDAREKVPAQRKANTANNSALANAKRIENDIPRPPQSLWSGIGQSSAVGQLSMEAEEEDDDDLMLVAVYEAEKSLEHESEKHQVTTCGSEDVSHKQHADLPGFDSSSGKIWIYPTNYPIRDYQLKISEAALFQNTLVCLPTGLGKTFIASVVMYNFYRWYPSGKIVFMAPTKPLVAQQIEACYKVMGIPQEHMAELTGSTQAQQRRELWRSKRVFFLTPQVMVNDLSRNTCPATQIKCIVIDEAHKALGNHAYCQVVRELANQTRQFRVLALSATPGGDIKAVQQVVSNLLISHFELRSEESLDVQPYSHHRRLEKVVVPLGESLSGYQSRYLQVLERFTARLTQMGVLSHRDLRSLTKYQFILARDQFRRNPPPHIAGGQHGVLEGDFALCISLFHGYELLQQMGLRSLFLFTQNIMNGSKESSRARNELQRNANFMDLYREMEAIFSTSQQGPERGFFYSHPKLQKLEEVVLQHFQTCSQSSDASSGSLSPPQGVATRVMIFSSFRESVQEIAEMLNRHRPLIRVMTFMGQASAGKAVRGFTQKEQLEVVQKFRQGGFNTLVSTCVGEEGLDIGEVDLIVCFDAQKSPIRLVQRMGRTGRRRQGRVVVILAEGREERTYNQSQSSKRSVYKSIVGKKHSFRLFPHSPRMLPEGMTPALHKMHITCGQFEAKETGRRSAKGRESRTLLQARGSLQQESVRDDGCLTPAEHALWTATMKLDENEPQPVFAPSHFLSVGTESTPQEELRAGPTRELCLWEWRHWQNQPLPTYRVEHSARCLHFTSIMELVDNMRQEEEDDYRCESELMSHLHRDDEVGRKVGGGFGKPTAGEAPRTVKPECTSVLKKRRSPNCSLNLQKVDERLQSEKENETPVAPCTLTKDHLDQEKLSSPPQSPKNNDLLMDVDMDCVMLTDENEDPQFAWLTQRDQAPGGLGDGQSEIQVTNSSPGTSGHLQTEEDCLDLENMFYLPKQHAGPKLLRSSGSTASLKAILTSVKELLARSPPQSLDPICSLAESEPVVQANEAYSDPREDIDQFRVDFVLRGDDDSMDGSSVDSVAEEVPQDKSGDREPPQPPDRVPGNLLTSPHSAASPSWEEIFEDEVHEDPKADGQPEAPPARPNPNVHEGLTRLDESVDLFGDDAFLQVSLPNIETPDKVPVTLSDRGDTEPMERPRPDGKQGERGTKTDSPKGPAKCSPASAEKRGSRAENSEQFDCSQDFFSVNFNLGFSFDSEEEEEEGPTEPASELSHASRPETARESASGAVEGHDSVNRSAAGYARVSTPKQRPAEKRERLSLSVTANGDPLRSPAVNERRKMTTNPSASTPNPVIRAQALPRGLAYSSPQQRTGCGSSRASLAQMVKAVPDGGLRADLCHSGFMNSDNEEEVIAVKRGQRGETNPLSSPEQSKIFSDVDSPVQVARKRVAALNTSEESGGESVSDDDFQIISVWNPRQPPVSKPCLQKPKKAARGNVRYFLDEEAELSEEEEDDSVSSDEDDGEEQNRTLEGFVVDSTQCSQGLDDSEMRGIYLKSVRSPAAARFKMPRKPTHRMDIFSQVPEQDESYGEDSFVVHGSEEEEEGSDDEDEGSEEEVVADVILEDSYVDGRRQYATRRRARLKQAGIGGGRRHAPGTPTVRKTKRSRIIRMEDSSEGEEDGEEKRKSPRTDVAPVAPVGPTEQKSEPVFKTPQCPKLSSHKKAGPVTGQSKLAEQEGRSLRRLSNQALLSDELDFEELPAASSHGDKTENQNDSKQDSAARPLAAPAVAPSAAPSAALPGGLCVLVDSRCITGGAAVVSCLRLRHGVTAQVCSLDGCDFVVSNRMGVEWQAQAELASTQNRKRLQERVQSMLGLYDRVCLIVEKDNVKTRDARQPFQRTRYYDNTLAGLVRANVRLLVSEGPEDTASLLAELARVEQRKGQAIGVPTEVKGHRQQALQFYLTLPCVSYVNALNMCQNFRSVAQLVSSSVEALQAGACISRSRAEEIYRSLRYDCNPSLMSTNTNKTSKCGS
ncbi:Fanconi anemia group M protein [Chanos chanos]|uniref:Fanconi anemia group M protein n=1 Tax=Chanos chanos TaxID=29144 RepID=A0A6J2W9P8_CHACN|nr:Fanconi anemia group M protein [Chanos chanos]